MRDDEIHELALAKAVELVGEMAYQLRGDFPNIIFAHPEIPFVEAATMRHRLVHSYDTLDPRRLWLTATASVPKLRRQLEPILIDADEDLS
ncbi:HepT-like ribonuclease domain-containing protein [Jiella pacifica]|uniref:HepT-like ribonuclease domain-containing protein n=1 Tax=Jiella pacifica TaxID=2696469 RepID=UPI0028AC8D9F|nr:HepT-like ribonuclease domain-containing protein [Jiella pacifica]